MSSLGASAATNPQAANDFAGVWRGTLQAPSGELDIVFRVTRLNNGEYAATFSIPQQKATPLIATVATQDDSVLLKLHETNSRYLARLSADGNQLTGTWRQPTFTKPLVLKRQLVANIPPGPPPPYHEITVSFDNPATKQPLAGTLSVPTGTGPFPAVVLLSDGDQAEAAPPGNFAPLALLAEYLTQHGFVVLRYDESGTGRSGGTPLTTATERVAEVRTTLNYLRARPEVNLDQLGLIGHGEGGNLALLAASLPIPPAYVVCLAASGLPSSEALLRQHEGVLQTLGVAPDQLAASVKRQQAMQEVVRNMPDNSQAQAILANMLRQGHETLEEGAAQLRASELVSPTYRATLAFNPQECLPKVTCPVLLLNGASDASTNADINLAALVKGLKNNKSVIMRKLPGVNHLFQPERTQWALLNGQLRPVFSPEALDIMNGWLASRTGKTSASR